MLPWVDVTEKTVYFIERFPAFHWTEYFSGKTTTLLLSAWAHGNAPPYRDASRMMQDGCRHAMGAWFQSMNMLSMPGTVALNCENYGYSNYFSRLHAAQGMGVAQVLFNAAT
eukprot:scaffold221451_cov24-Tisochrysis_lutea.AAC.4